MDPSVLTSALTSLGVSALTSIGFQTYLTKRIEHHFQQRLERYKADLEVEVHTKEQIARRRLEAYPKLVELSYRTRNIARDLARTASSFDSRQEIVGRIQELEDTMYRFRIDLEADQLFSLLHTYKDLLWKFYYTGTDSKPSADSCENPATDSGLAEAFLALNECHAEVAHRLTKTLTHRAEAGGG